MDSSSEDLSELKSVEEVEEVCSSHSIRQLQSLTRFFQLVRRLYLPGPPREISQIQNVLQKLQKSSQGWHLADALLHSRDTNVRFFGALTFNIKIHNDWSDLAQWSSYGIILT